MSNLIHGEMFGGVHVIFSTVATEPDGYNFKDSKHRKPRVYKKLIRRFGQRERRKPCAYMALGKLICHPALESEIRARFLQP